MLPFELDVAHKETNGLSFIISVRIAITSEGFKNNALGRVLMHQFSGKPTLPPLRRQLGDQADELF